MRVARLVGLSSDGRFVIVATEGGVELAIAADDRLRAALRGDRPRLGQLEIQMESALSPREIQTRIRSGESVDDVARVAGIERERVERFAAPVIAEREHVAGLAMASSARRRGETSSHRTLRGVLNERLLSRGVDVDTVRWDSYRLDDGRWAVTADYFSGETPRQAVFNFDLPGRYSVAANDEGRWVLGDTSPSRGPQPDRRPPVPGESGDDTEPTLDLSDELALVRAIQDIPVPPSTDLETHEVEVADRRTTIADVVQINRGSEPAADQDTTSDAGPEDTEPEDDESEGAEPGETNSEETSPQEAGTHESGLDALDDIFEDQEAAEPTVEVERDQASVGDAEVPLAEGEEPELHDAEADAVEIGAAAAESAPSDASAVPELSAPLQPDAWEPAIVVDYPIEPSDDGDGLEVPEGSDDPGRLEAPVAGEDRRDEASALEVALFRAREPQPDPEPEQEPEPDSDPQPEPEPERATRAAAAAEEPEDEPLPLDVPDQPTAPPATKPARRKRAAVPSWDEIVFGGPKQ